MKSVFTSDWQLHTENLHKAKAFVKFLLAYCIKHGIKVVFHLGDSKHQYNPLDIRVLNFKLWVIKIFKEAGIVWYQLMGNHDRIGMTEESGNWFPALRAAGAICITRAKTFSVGGMAVAAVPYMSDPLALRNALKRVSKQACDLLIFHNTILGCKANVQSSLKEGVHLEDLRPEVYRWCIGGHIHFPQKLGRNSYFVGSPFAMDWGEANQQKRIIVIASTRKGITSVQSPIPGMYDPSWPNFRDSSPDSWAEARVRIHVPCDSSVTDPNKTLQMAITAAEQKYRGAIVEAVPEYADKDTNKLIENATASDEQLLEEYIEASTPAYLSNQKQPLISYLKYQLARHGFVRRTSQHIKLLEAEGRNFLCYKKVKIDFKQKGILVVTGKNKDWPGRSNGSGKTSLMMLPAVALCGRTFKGQANDKWARRDSTGLSWVKLRLKLQDGRRCTITRTRRPVRLRLLINGIDRSTGIGVRGTQQAIENLTGLTWESLQSAIYIDQKETNKILDGSDTERKAIFARLLNLERFELAKAGLKEELKALSLSKEKTELCLEMAQSKLATLKRSAKDIEAVDDMKEVTHKLKATKKKIKFYKKIIPRLSHSDAVKKYARMKEKHTQKLEAIDNHKQTLSEVIGAYKSDIAKITSIEDKCPTCKQDVPEAWHKKRLLVLNKGYKIILERVNKINKLADKSEKFLELAKTKLSQASSKVDVFQERLSNKQQELSDITERYDKCKAQQQVKTKYTNRITQQELVILRLERMVKAVNHDINFLTFGVKVFSKDGLPAYMIRSIVPQLNIAAEKYARIISENEIKVKFVVDNDGAIDIKIRNKHGGKGIVDQSQGETRIASIITSFAVREVINPANLLILDEPGEGLDQHNAKLFAQVLKEIAKKFGTVMLTTHSPVILAELDSERRLNIEKHNKIARLVA